MYGTLSDIWKLAKTYAKLLGGIASDHYKKACEVVDKSINLLSGSLEDNLKKVTKQLAKGVSLLRLATKVKSVYKIEQLKAYVISCQYLVKALQHKIDNPYL